MSANIKPASNPDPKPLPAGYLWRLLVIVFLLVGGGLCMIFFSSIVGIAMSFAGLAFGKLSGLNKMLEDYNAK